MSKQLMKLSDFPELTEPPFAKELIRQMHNKKIIIGTAPIGVNSNEASSLFFGKQKLVDSNHFTKVFNDGLKEFFNLSKGNMKVLSYIMSITPMKADRVRFSIRECMEYSNTSYRNTVTRSITALIQAKFIARTTTAHIYWINPLMFFRGDRLVLAREYRKIKEKPTQELSQHSTMYNASPEAVMVPSALNHIK